MATQRPTPEEKLFSVIQGEPHPPIRPKARAVSPAGFSARLSVFVGSFDLPRVNQLLVVVIGLLGMACLSSLFWLQPRIDRLMGKAQTHAAPALPGPMDGLRPVEAYLQTITTQDPFRIGEVPRTASTTDTPPNRLDPKTLVSGLRLVGIAWAEEPIAMVEQQQQTHFLKKGDTLGTLTVKEIFRDHVLFQANDQDVELF